jgi:hypothetical protein
MSFRKAIRIAILVTLILLASFIYFISGYQQWIETNYSTGFFPRLASVLRFALGSIPFSIGDVIYSIVFVAISSNSSQDCFILKTVGVKNWPRC